MTANEMRTAIREHLLLHAVSMNDLETANDRILGRLYKAFFGSAAAANAQSDTHDVSGRQFVVNDADVLALAQRVKDSIDTALTVNDLAKLPIDRLHELQRQHDWTGYNLNATADDEGALLRAVTALKNTVQSASPGALVTLGLATLESWRKQVDKTVAASSASVARNADRAYTGADEFAGYDMNNPAA